MTKEQSASLCYLCKGKNFRNRPGKVRDNSHIEIRECSSCGLVFLSPVHANEDVSIEACGEWDDERRFRFLKCLIENKEVLDFGCGKGGFLLKAREVAKRVVGVEVQERLKPHYSRIGLNVVAHINETAEYYDVITLFHVLEHFADPRTVLSEVSKKLGNEGQLIVEVPSANDALLQLYGSEPFSNFTYWSCHLFLFNSHTLPLLAEQAGLKVNYIKQIQRYPLSNHLYWLAKGSPGGHKEWHFLDSPEMNAAYEKQLASIGVCDTVLGSFSIK